MAQKNHIAACAGSAVWEPELTCPQEDGAWKAELREEELWAQQKRLEKKQASFTQPDKTTWLSHPWRQQILQMTVHIPVYHVLVTMSRAITALNPVPSSSLVLVDALDV